MKPVEAARKAAVLFVVLCMLFLFPASRGLAQSSLPQPKLIFTGTEDYEADGARFTRYWLSVSNRSEFPDELFAAEPNLPPCGKNTNSSRSWVDIYQADGKRIYGFCALNSANSLGKLWFAVPRDQTPPDSVYIVIVDRKLKRELKSNLAQVKGSVTTR